MSDSQTRIEADLRDAMANITELSIQVRDIGRRLSAIAKRSIRIGTEIEDPNAKEVISATEAAQLMGLHVTASCVKCWARKDGATYGFGWKIGANWYFDRLKLLAYARGDLLPLPTAITSPAAKASQEAGEGQ